MRYGLTLFIAVTAVALAVARAEIRKNDGQPAGWRALLIAGDFAEPAFDNAVDTMEQRLLSFGIKGKDISVLKASGDGAPAATRVNITRAFATLNPAPDDGCFVFITSHGVRNGGLFLADERAFFTPYTLTRLLNGACGARPSVLILSGCYSGIYVEEPPLPAPNRTILTAARADRPSFGCNAGLQYTIFDRCILDSLKRGLTWSDVMEKTRTCVSGNEFDMKVEAPSEPQLSVGDKEKALRVFSP